MIRPVHHVRGRARFAVPGLRGSTSQARFLEGELLHSPGITGASASSVTGKVLVFFSEHETAEDVAFLIDKIQREFSETHTDEPTARGDADRRDRWWLRGRSGLDGHGFSRKSPGEPLLMEAGEAWHTLEPEAVARRLDASLSSGLSQPSVEEHRARFGDNELPGMKTRSFMDILSGQAASLPVALTGIAAGISVLTGALIEGALILGVAAVNLAVGSLTEHRAESELKATREMVDLRARVQRDGGIEEIPFNEVVIGDVLSLQPGSRIPADARVVRSKSLALDEASLTGESMPVPKSVAALPRVDLPVTERVNMVYRGTLVVEGTGRAVVVATGYGTVLGRLQRFLWEVFPPEALLANDLRRVAHQIIQGNVVGCGILAVVSLVRGQGLLKILGSSIFLFSASIPAGLSTLAIGAFALGHRDLRENRILVRRLRALGNLASIQVMCFDKTGTLTCNRMTARELCSGDKRLRVGHDGASLPDWQSLQTEMPDILWLIQLSALCNLAHTAGLKDHRSLEISATENSLIELAERTGMDVFSLRTEHPILEIEHRSEEHPFMVTVHQWDEETLLKAVKGSPHDVLDRCSHYAGDGEIRPLGEDQRDAIELENLRMAGSGLRVLGFAYSKDVHDDSKERGGDAPGYIWTGLVGLEDPLREEARPLIRALHRAGIRTVVITGDQSSTAQHIGNELELSGAAPLRILDSSDLQSLDAAGTRSIATQAHVFARLNPTQKLQVVQAYQSAGMSVAMVGDGLNDVLALRVADVGIAMGRDGSVLARRSADLVLEDDNLQSVMLAIATGRGFYRSMHRSVRFLLTAHHMDLFMNISEKGLGIGRGPGMTQALWNNLMCLSLALDPPSLCYTDEGPIPPEESLLQPHDLEKTYVDAARLLGLAAIPASCGALKYGAGQEAARLFSQSASMNQILYGAACRRRNGASPDELPSNPLLDLTLMGAVGSHLLGALLPAMGKSAGQVASRLLDVLILGATGFFCLGLLKENGADNREATIPAPPEADFQPE